MLKYQSSSFYSFDQLFFEGVDQSLCCSIRLCMVRCRTDVLYSILLILRKFGGYKLRTINFVQYNLLPRITIVLLLVVCVILNVSGHFEYVSEATKNILLRNGLAKSICTLSHGLAAWPCISMVAGVQQEELVSELHSRRYGTTYTVLAHYHSISP